MQTLKGFGIEIDKDKFQEALIYGLACCYLLVEKEVSGYLRPFKLSPAKFNALMVIKHMGKGKGISQIEISRRLIVTASNMTRLLDRLSREGLIEREAQKGDRRVNLIKISKKGSDLLDAAWPGYYKKITEAAYLLKKEELKSAAALILKWCDKLQEYKQGARKQTVG